jgi:DnaJ-class molecular chaperone
MSNFEWDTADIKTCPHGYAFIDCCTECGGAGEVKVPKTHLTCPCCRGREKTRPCKKCNGTGIEMPKS